MRDNQAKRKLLIHYFLVPRDVSCRCAYQDSGSGLSVLVLAAAIRQD
jgi:hypothetical protein